MAQSHGNVNDAAILALERDSKKSSKTRVKRNRKTSNNSEEEIGSEEKLSVDERMAFFERYGLVAAEGRECSMNTFPPSEYVSY